MKIRCKVQDIINNKLVNALLLTLIGSYIFLQIFSIKEPGLFDDEAKWATAIISGQFPTITLFNKKIIVMINEYHGPLEIYINSLFVLLFGFNIMSLRLIGLFFGLLVAGLTYLFIKKNFNKQIAIMTVSLLVTDLTFFRTTKMEAGYSPIFTAIFLGALLFFSKWYYSNKICFFYLSCFLMGLGLNTRAHFLWFIIAAGCLILIFKKDIRKAVLKKKKFILSYLIGGIAMFSLGLSMFLIYNIMTHFSTLTYIKDHFFLTKCGIDNSAYVNNLLIQFKNLYWGLINSKVPYEFSGYNVKFSTHYYFWILLSCLIWLMLYVFLSKSKLFKKKIIFIMLLIFIVFLLSPFTLSSHSSHFYLPVLMPFIYLLIAVTFFLIFDKFKHQPIRYFITLLFVFIIIVNLSGLAKYNNFLKRTGGTGYFSSAIYNLADWLIAHNYLRPVVADWGIYHNLLFLSKGKISPVPFEYTQNLTNNEPERSKLEMEFTEQLKQKFKDNDNIYIFYNPRYSLRNSLKIFRKLAMQEKKKIIFKKIFYQKDGQPNLLVYTIK